MSRLIVEARVTTQRTLGVRLAPDGSNDVEEKYLTGIAKDWAERIRTGHIPRVLVWESLTTIILKSIQYPLPATTLERKECEGIMSVLMKMALPCSGIVRSLPRALVFGPKHYQGLGIPCLFTLQQVDHIERILRFCYAKDNLTGQLIRQSIEATKLEIGCSGSLFAQPFGIYGILATRTWVTASWRFLSRNGMQIKENDQLLMPAFVEAGFK